MFVLLVAAVMLLVVAAVAVLIVQAQNRSERDARSRALTAAETIARSPETLAALRSADPSATLQPRAEEDRRLAGIDYIVITNRRGIRYTQPDPDLIGRPVAIDLSRALAGETYTERGRGPLGRVQRAVVPITRADGSVVGVVGAGVKVAKVNEVVERQLPVLFGGAGGVLILATGGVALVSRHLRSQTRGLGPTEITRMYEHHDAVLHSVREGVLIVDSSHRLLLANDEAQQLLELPPDAQGRPVTELALDAPIAELLASGRPATDEVHIAGDRVLAVNVRSTELHGRRYGSVATLRDTTELRVLTGKADVARGRLKLLYDAGVGIGSTLEVTRTAEELTEVAVPRFADFVTVDLPEDVLNGEEPTDPNAYMRRTAAGGIREDSPLFPVGELIEYVPSTPQARGFGSGHAVLEPDLHAAPGWLAQHPERSRRVLDYGIHSLITIPLRARGVTLGMASFWPGGEA